MEIAIEQLGDQYTQFLEYIALLPKFIDLDEAIICHGYLEPGVPLDNQKTNIILGRKSGTKSIKTRYGKQWYELYDRTKPVIVGHRNYTANSDPLIYNDVVYGLDTHCYSGGALTGILLPEFKIISVKTRKNYWSDVIQAVRK